AAADRHGCGDLYDPACAGAIADLHGHGEAELMAMRGYGYDTITEGSSGLYTATLATPGGTAVTAVMLTALSLTLYDKDTGAIVNSRDAQDVLNKGNVTIDAEGEIAWSIQPADT